MNDLTSRLRDADPVRHEPGLRPESRDAMRRAIVAAAEAGAPRIPRWRQPLALAAMTVLAAGGVMLAHRFADHRERTRMTAPPPAPISATQLQFRTPGGTRIIWTIDPSFQLRGTLP
jgi:hypothetical protein